VEVKKLFFINLLLALIVASLLVFLSARGALEHLNLIGTDILFHLRGPQPYNPNILVIEINEDNISKVGRWPWDRKWHATMAMALKGLGAKFVYFDILFSEPSSQEDDDLFSAALKESGNVYLPFAFTEDDTGSQERLQPIKKFSAYEKGTGAINIYPDVDGVLRRLPLFFKRGENVYPHLVLRMAMDYLDLKIKHITPNWLILADDKRTIRIPLVDGNKMLINWPGKWRDTFRHRSYLSVLNDYKKLTERQRIDVDAQNFQDSICLIGVTGIGLYDIKPTPMDPVFPGVGLSAAALSNILDQRFLHLAPSWIIQLFIYIFALTVALAAIGRRLLIKNLIVLASGAGFFLASFFLFKANILVIFFPPLLSLFGSYAVIGLYGFLRVTIEKKQLLKLSITDELTGLHNVRYFNIILKQDILVARTNKEKAKFCILVSDIDHFKHFNDTYGHKAGDLVLREVAGVLIRTVRNTDLVARYGGEEMVVLLRNCTLTNALIVAEKIRSGVQGNPFLYGTQSLSVTISIGVASFARQDSEDSFFKRADSGLYKAKGAGRNRVETIEEVKKDSPPTPQPPTS
jgi:diguanylate cyclase (GGDEF)-like protein